MLPLVLAGLDLEKPPTQLDELIGVGAVGFLFGVTGVSQKRGVEGGRA